MTRQKKSRKPSSGTIAPKKTEKTSKVDPKDKRVRKKTGNTPGTRQQTQNKQTDNKAPQANQDPRLGSKKPIVLIKADKTQAPEKAKKDSAKASGIAAIRVLATTPQEDYFAELKAIENDELLQEILAKQDDDIDLTESEVNHFNRLMDRHEFLREKLGLDNDDDEDFAADHELSEEELWEKFNNADYDPENNA